MTNGKHITTTVWPPPVRYLLYGINAHINGDIWQALVDEFTSREIKELKPYYKQYKKGLLEIYQLVYDAALIQNQRNKLLHIASIGMDKFYGKILLNHWRNRQMKLAQLYYDDRNLFEKKAAKLRRKINQINELIRKNT